MNEKDVTNGHVTMNAVRHNVNGGEEILEDTISWFQKKSINFQPNQKKYIIYLYCFYNIVT